MVSVSEQRVFDLSQIDRTNISQQLPFTTEAAEHLLSQHLQREEVDTKASFMRDRIIFNPVGFRESLSYRDIAQFLKCDTIPGLFMLYVIDENTHQHYFESYKCARPRDLPDIHALLSITMTDKYRELKDAPRVTNGTKNSPITMKERTYVHAVRENDEDTHQPLRQNLSVINASPELRKPAPENVRSTYAEPSPFKQSFVSYPVTQQRLSAAVADRSSVHRTHKTMTLLSPTSVHTPTPRRTLIVPGKQSSVILVDSDAPSENVVFRKPPTLQSARLSHNSRWYRSEKAKPKSQLVSVVNRTKSQEAPPRLESARFNSLTPVQRHHTYTPIYPSHGPVDDLVLFRRKKIPPSATELQSIYRTRSYEQPLNYSYTNNRHSTRSLYRPTPNNTSVRKLYVVEQQPSRLQSDHITNRTIQLQQRVPTQVVRPITQTVPVHNTDHQYRIHSNPPVYRTTKTVFTGAPNVGQRMSKSDRVIIMNSPSNETVTPITRYSQDSFKPVPSHSNKEQVYLYSETTRHVPN